MRFLSVFQVSDSGIYFLKLFLTINKLAKTQLLKNYFEKYYFGKRIWEKNKNMKTRRSDFLLKNKFSFLTFKF